MSSRHLLVPALLALLAACQTAPAPLPQAGSMDAGLGEAVKYDIAIQTIDPDPVYRPGGAQPGDSGEKGAAAAKRYRTDQVKETERQATSTMGTGSSSGPR